VSGVDKDGLGLTESRPVRLFRGQDLKWFTLHGRRHYLISVLYHALQAAETAAQYKQEADQQDDQELGEFFDQARTSNTELAQQAKPLLAVRLEDPDEDEEEEEQRAPRADFRFRRGARECQVMRRALASGGVANTFVTLRGVPAFAATLGSRTHHESVRRRLQR
jgi:hypothetical protein